MKTLILLLVIALSFTDGSAQLVVPDLSYPSVIQQKAGFTNFEVRYERPMQRGRLIFGGLVPYGKPWRTGGGFHNTISFDQDVVVQGKKVARGTYHLVTIPDLKSWKVIFSTDSNVFAKNKPYEENLEALRIEVKPEKTANHFEATTIDIDLVNNDALFTISWDHTAVSFLVETGTTSKVMNQIKKLLKNGSTNADEYEQAANFIAHNLPYLRSSAKDTALLLIGKAMALDKHPRMYHTKRDIFWFSKDMQNYEKVSHEWIARLRKGDLDYDPSEDIRMIEKDLEHRKTIK